MSKSKSKSEHTTTTTTTMKHEIKVRVFSTSLSSRCSVRKVLRKVNLISNKDVRIASIISLLRLSPDDLLRLKMEQASTRQHVRLDPDGVVQHLDVHVCDSRYALNLYV